MDIGMNDPKTFWNIIDDMNHWGKEQKDETDHIKPASWATYFKKLLNKSNVDTPNIENRTQALHDFSGTTFDPILDRRIECKELHEGLSKVKGNKAPGPDGILVEYLKIFAETHEGILLTIIRPLFSNHVYPSQWDSNFLKPIYKKGDMEDPDNYRGLAIGPAFAKLFSQILLKRLITYIEEKKAHFF